MKRVMIACVAAFSGVAWAQSLMSTPPAPPPDSTALRHEAAPDVKATSLLLVEEPKPKEFQVNDKVTIIVSESSNQTSQQVLDAKKDTTLKGSLNKFPDLGKFIQGELTNGDSSPVASVDLSSGEKFKGDGKYQRTDRFTDRITATVIDVKPNGVLVLEARRTIIKDKESQTFVLTGECRSEDVTTQNTVLSNQLAEMVMSVQNEGDVKDTATKGWITRLFEAVFNF